MGGLVDIIVPIFIPIACWPVPFPETFMPRFVVDNGTNGVIIIFNPNDLVPKPPLFGVSNLPFCILWI